MTKRLSLILIAVFGLAGAWLYVAGSRSAYAPAADYVLLSGEKTSSAQLEGKVYLVNFWATSCTTCVAEMPKIVETWRKFEGRGFETVAVAMKYDPPAYVVRFAQSRAIPFKIAIDNTGAVARAWGDVQLTPTSFLVDKQGRVVKRFVGEPDFKDLHRQIETLLGQG